MPEAARNQRGVAAAAPTMAEPFRNRLRNMNLKLADTDCLRVHLNELR
jgi:hypothetical protein